MRMYYQPLRARRRYRPQGRQRRAKVDFNVLNDARLRVRKLAERSRMTSSTRRVVIRTSIT